MESNTLNAINAAFKAANEGNESSLKTDTETVDELVNNKQENVDTEQPQEVVSEVTEEVTETPQEEVSEPQQEVEVEVGQEPTETEVVSEEQVEESQPTEPTLEEIDWSGDAKSKGWISPEEKDKVLEGIHEEYQSELTKRLENPTDNPLVNKLVKLAADGKAIDLKFIERQFINYDDYKVTEKDSAMRLIEMDMEAQGKSPLEIKKKKREYKDLFNGLYDESDEEYVELMDDLQLESTESRKRLKINQADESLPDVEKITEEQRAKQEAEAKKNLEVWTSTVKNEVNAKESIKLSLNKEGDFEYTLSSDDKKVIQDILSSDFGFTQGFFTNGVFDFEAAIEAAIFKNPETKGRFLKKIASQYEAAGMDKLISKQKNTKIVKSEPTRKAEVSREAKAANSLFKNRYTKTN